MSFNYNWLESVTHTVKPIDVSSMRIDEWFRDHNCLGWAANTWWFYRSKKQTVHMVVALIDMYSMVELRDYRWDVNKDKWVLTKKPVTMNLLEFYRQYWYMQRMNKNHRAPNTFMNVVKTVDMPIYLSEICKQVHYRIAEYAVRLMYLLDTDKNLFNQFATDLLLDFGIGETIAAICYLAENENSGRLPVDEFMLKASLKRCKEFLELYHKEVVKNKITYNFTMTSVGESELIAMLAMQILKWVY